MEVQTTDVVRQSIRFLPSSNTELNQERLPDPESLRGMELRYRVEPTSLMVLRQHPVASMLLASSVAFGYAMLWHYVPTVGRWLLNEAQQLEGMMIVGGMLAGLGTIIGALSLVFVPRAGRWALAAVSLPLVVSTVLGVWGKQSDAFVLCLCGLGVSSFFIKGSLVRFHRSWLAADPQMTNSLSGTWQAMSRSGWSFPTFKEAGEILHRYLAYEFSGPTIPGVWVAPSSRGIRTALIAFLTGSALSLGNPALMLLIPLAVLMWAVGRAKFIQREVEKFLPERRATDFEALWTRLRDSDHITTDPVTGAPVREAEHILLGFEPVQRFPILLHESMLYEHTYIAGRTGSNKTSIGLMLPLIQLIRGYRTPSGTRSEKRPIVIIDLKGDEVLLQTAKLEAEARGQKFRFFTLEPGRSSYYFNPFLGFKSATLTVPQLVQSNLEALDLFHGTGYGKGYYSQRSRFLLTQALNNSTGVNSFQDLYARLKTLYSERPEDFRDAFELLSVIQSLTFYDQLVTSALQERADETIRLDRVLEDREVVYFWLPSVRESVAVAQVGKLVLFNLRTAAQERQSAGRPKRQAFLFIDEFQRLAGENFQQILQQARSAGIATVLANQSLSDLKTPDWDLTPTIRTNTRTKMYFSITEPEEIRTFRELSGEELQTYGSNDAEEIRMRFSTKDVASLSDHPKRLLLHISSGSGYAQFGGLPVPVETDWPISKEVSEARAAMPWPPGPTIVGQPQPQKGQKPLRHSSPVPASSNNNPGSMVQPKTPLISQAPQATSMKPQANQVKRLAQKQNGAAAPKKAKETKKKAAPKLPKVVPMPVIKEAFTKKIQSLFED